MPVLISFCPPQLHPWLYTAGYLLAFGTMLAKMGRVYHIFHNPTPGKMVSMEIVSLLKWRWRYIEEISVAAVVKNICYDNHWHTWYSSLHGVISVALCCMRQCLNGISTDLQKVKDWHLVTALLGVTAVGIALLVARSVLLPKQSELIEDSENSEGRTVRARIHTLALKHCSITSEGCGI